MRVKHTRIAGLAVAIFVSGLVYIVSLHAQQSTTKPSAPPVATNWVGYLVVGQTGTMDRIAPGPSPTLVRQVEIGLRSDGVVVWREASKPK